MPWLRRFCLQNFVEYVRMTPLQDHEVYNTPIEIISKLLREVKKRKNTTLFYIFARLLHYARRYVTVYGYRYHLRTVRNNETIAKNTVLAYSIIYELCIHFHKRARVMYERYRRASRVP